MSDVREATETLIEDNPDIEPVVREILEVDAAESAWEFDDLSTDSGTFGEIASTAIVDKTSSGYEVTDREAVLAGLGDDTSDGPTRPDISISVPTPSIRDAGPLVAALFVVGVFRAYIYPAVFRKGDVVLLGNDAYKVRYTLEQQITTSSSIADLPTILSGVTDGNALFHATIWWLGDLFGGGPDAVGPVLAWYPVVAALISAALVYALASAVTRDHRIALASVLLLAVTPAHALRTALGFADHHAFEYPWLALTVVALVWLADTTPADLTARTVWIRSGVLGVAVAGYTLSWVGSPIVLAPIGIYLACLAVLRMYGDESPTAALLPVTGGLVVATAITGSAAVTLGWATGGRLYVLGALCAGSVALTVVAAIADRFDVSYRTFAGVELGAAVVAGVLVRFVPPLSGYLNRGFSYFSRTGELSIAESLSLIGTNAVAGPIYLFGLFLFIALPYLVWIALRSARTYTPRLLPLVVYAWYLLGLAAFVQRRFTGELSLVLAVVLGIAFVHIAAKTDITDPIDIFGSESGYRTLASHSAVDIHTVGYLAGLFVLVAGLSVLQTGVYVGNAVHSGDEHDAAQYMETYADEQSWSYPENYVFSHWGTNRMYNYFVNGDESHPQNLWYGYARNNYGDFVTAANATAWYQRLSDRPTGFIITEDVEQDLPEQSLHVRLHQQYGSTNGSAVSHYRAIYTAQGGAVKVFTLVPGGTITGTATPETTVPVSTNVSITGETFTYRTHARTDSSGRFSVTVPYPGRYTVGNRTVTVPEGAIRNGTSVQSTPE